MKKCKVWCACLLVWIISLSGAAVAEGYEALCAQSKVNMQDTAAWIEIPGASFCRPVMRHAQDDSYYSSHDAGGAESETGELYTQASYNAADFQDPVTIIYGGSTKEGSPFRDLQETFSGKFDECRSIVLHLPEGTLEYEVFAAVPYSSVHILHYYDFAVEQRFNTFFSSVFSTRLLGMHLDAAGRPEFGDRVLILSTGLRGERTQRYLVMAKLVTQEPLGTQ